MTALELIQATAQDFGIKAIADDIGKADSTLYAELNPFPDEGRTHKLGYKDWVRILRLTQDFRSLTQTCCELGFIAVPVPRKSHTKDWLRHLADVAKEAADTQVGLAQALADGRMDGHEIPDCRREAWEAVEAFAALFIALQEAEGKED